MEKSVLAKGIIKRVLTVGIFAVLQAAIFFYCAGGLDFPRAWLFFALTLAYLACNMVIFMKYCPELIAERGEAKKGVKKWDAVFAVLYMALILVLPAAIGLDIGQAKQAPLGIEFAVLGTIVFIASCILGTWAMLENKFFELTVRVQKEKGHKVVTTGPYSLIRHPGYAGMILLYYSMPLIIGSLYGLACSTIIFALFAGRTYMEDKTLQKELEGYKDYAKKTKHRLIPFVW